MLPAPTTFVSRDRPRRGSVAEFDEARGLGVVAEASGQRFGFHATAVADGTRRIEVGTEVSFLVAPGHGGRLEARGLAPIG